MNTDTTSTNTAEPRGLRRMGRAALLALAPVAALGLIAPTAASASSPQPPAGAPAPATASSQPPTSSDKDQDGWFETKGTAVTLRNDTGKNIWVRHYRYGGQWLSPVKLDPGASRQYQGNWPGTDDVELRVFKSQEAATDNSVFKAYEIDAENPAYSSPWVSVSLMNHYFGVGETTTWYRAGWLGDGEFWGKRHDDSKRYKEFEIHMKHIGS